MTLEFLVGVTAGAVPAIAATASVTSGIIRRRAAIDPLTGIPNRRGLPRLDRLVRTGLRRGEQVAVVVMDLRGFKAINDTYGHEAGDEVLRLFAQRLVGCELVLGAVRLGGDEFAAVITAPVGAGEDPWRELVAEIEAAVSGRSVSVRNLRTQRLEQVFPEATYGAAVARDADTFPELLCSADYSMYLARVGDDTICTTIGGLEVWPRNKIRPRDLRPTRRTVAV